jgi:hypothetical protein
MICFDCFYSTSRELFVNLAKSYDGLPPDFL